jgi:ketosteroid isomerase-like protein
VTSPAANVELVRAGFEVFNAGDVDECLPLMTPDIIINLPNCPNPSTDVRCGGRASR